jgi:hypothetical protein
VTPEAVLSDPTEAIRRMRLAELSPGVDRAELERRHGQVWDPAGLSAEFEVVGFMAPYIVVRRKADGKVGSLTFQHEPRFYFEWKEDQ